MKTALLIFGYSLAFALAVWVALLWGENRQLKDVQQADAELIAAYQRCMKTCVTASRECVSNLFEIVNKPWRIP